LRKDSSTHRLAVNECHPRWEVVPDHSTAMRFTDDQPNGSRTHGRNTHALWTKLRVRFHGPMKFRLILTIATSGDLS
jgi:hypothetical protein